MERDLKADLDRVLEREKEYQHAKELKRPIGKESLETMRIRTHTNLLWYAGHNGPTWLRLAIAEKERADKAEALARELVEVLLLYEKWEADLLMDNSLWQSASGLPFITQEVWDELVAVQTERNKVLHKVKEVLGDEN